jgi:hypothetical protein
MPKYLFLICVEENTPIPNGREDGEAWAAELDSRGARKLGNALHPRAEAKSVRVRGGEVLTTDGPFAETKEAIAGFDLIECGAMEEAVEIAGKHPVARAGTVEIRELLDWPG